MLQRLARRLPLLLALATWSLASYAAPAPSEPAEQAEASETAPDTGDSAPNASEPAGEAESLTSPERLRQLSEAFKNFTPSEEISADNAVPFPADI